MKAKWLTLAVVFFVFGALAQSPEGQMRLSVVDAQTGHGLAGVKVRAWVGSGLVTDESGSCSFPLPHPGAGRFFYRITLTKPGYVPKFITWSQAQDDKIEDIPSQYTARLDPGVTIGGIVKNESGEPIPGARVTISGPPPPADGQRQRSAIGPNFLSERTDEAGRWQFSEAPKDFQNFTFRVVHPDYVPSVFACEGGEIADPGIVQWKEGDYLAGTAMMLLTHGIELSGIVVDTSGKPVPVTTITRNHEWRNPAATLATGDDGRFKIINLRPGEMILTFQAAGLAAQTREVTLTPGMPELKVEMKPGNIFQGQVVDEAGKPIAGAIVQLDRLDLGPLEYDWSIAADDQGRFLWNSAPDGPHPYYISASGYHSRAETDLVADGRERIISLRHAVEGDKTVIDGHVTEAASKEPVTNMTICLKEFKDGGVGYSHRAISGTNGYYSVGVDLAAAGCMIEIVAPGYAPQMSDKRSSRDGDQRLDFALVRGEGLSGTVYRADGKPAAGAEVAICTQQDGVSLGQGHFVDRFQTTIVAADENGNFMLPPASGAQTICAVDTSGFGETNIDGLKGPCRITLAAWGSLHGTASSGGKPKAGEKLALFRPRTEAGKAGVSLDRYDFTAATGVDGAFSFSNLPPGKVLLLRVGENRSDPLQYVDVASGQATGPIDANVEARIEQANAPESKELKLGDVAPLFETKTIEGQPLRLADYKGKYVLLDFWATWCGPCVAETPHLKAVHEAFLGDDRFVMISLSLDDASEAPAEFARKNNIKWTQGFLGEWSSSKVTPLYGVESIPAIFLVGPDGKIIGRDLRGDEIRAAVEKALGKH